MSFSRWLISLLSAVAFAAFAQVPIRVNVHLVNVAFTVRDGSGRLAAGLGQDDFEVLEDGVPRKIAFFAHASDVPLNLGLLVDASGSQDRFAKEHRKDFQAFLDTVLGSQDRAFLVCFGNHVRLASDYSASGPELLDALESYSKGHNHARELGPTEERILGTAFYDAIYYSNTEMLASANQGRSALIIFSDGEDNSSSHHMLDAIESAQANDVVLFCVRYTEVKHGRLNARNKYGISVMERIARETGGADFDAREKHGVKESFRQIGEQLRSAYRLGYYSGETAPGSGFHKITLRAKDPGLTIRARTGYFTP